MYLIEIEKNAENFLKKLNKRDADMIFNKIYSIPEKA